MLRNRGRILCGTAAIAFVLVQSSTEVAHGAGAPAFGRAGDERFVVRVGHEHLTNEDTRPHGFDTCACDADGATMFLTAEEIEGLAVPYTVVEPLRDYVRRFRPVRTMATVGVPSIAKLLGEPTTPAPGLGQTAGSLTLEYDRYHTPAEGVMHYQALAAAYPQITQLITIGQSVEMRDIIALKVSDNPEIDEPQEQAIFFCGVHHAREWATHEIMLYFAEQLVTRYDTDPRIRNIVDHAEVWLVPVVNPDGFEFTWTDNRFWRKNRRFVAEFEGNPYYGVDINRNYDYRWGPFGGSSGNPFAETYRGTAPASEPETQAIQNLLAGEKPAIAVSYHTYSQLALYPWGYTDGGTPQSYSSLRAIADNYVAKLRQVHGMTYTPGPINYALYATNGDLTDYSYAVHGALAYTPEARPASSDLGGFVLPEDQILPNNQENFAAALWMMDNVANARSVPVAEGLLSPGENLFSIPQTPVNQRPEIGLAMTLEATTSVSTWFNDLMHFIPDFYGYPTDMEALGSGSVFRFLHTRASAPWADGFTEYSALPHVFDGGALVMLENVGAPAVNYVGVPFETPVKMSELSIYRRIMQPIGTTFGLREVIQESRTALEDLASPTPWISWRWFHRGPDGTVLVSHPTGEDGADEYVHPFLGYEFTSNVPSFDFGSSPVYLLRFPPPVRTDGNDDGEVNLLDYAVFHGCVTGPQPVELTTECAVYDFEHDFDVDAADLGVMQLQFLRTTP